MITFAYVLATIAMLLIVAGLITARQRRRHVPLMLSAFAFDMVGLVIVEFGPMFSGRTDPVTGVLTEPGPMKVIHASVATLAVVLYVAQIVTGRKILAGDRSRLPGHKKLAVFFLAARLAAYVTMFMLP
ncbi:MAG: hypothetical protein H6807_03050 [Planctomycetes bacterium]|nr:hypothetical protein [Planctomycetota bacterium]